MSDKRAVLAILCRERDAWERFARSMRRRGWGPLDAPLLTVHDELRCLPDWRALAKQDVSAVGADGV